MELEAVILSGATKMHKDNCNMSFFFFFSNLVTFITKEESPDRLPYKNEE